MLMLDSREDMETVLNGPPGSKQAQRRLGILCYAPWPSSEERHCASCGQEIWVSPVQLQILVDNPETTFECFACAGRADLAAASTPPVAPTERFELLEQYCRQ
jgi:hypothetical protein